MNIDAIGDSYREYRQELRHQSEHRISRRFHRSDMAHLCCSIKDMPINHTKNDDEV